MTAPSVRSRVGRSLASVALAWALAACVAVPADAPAEGAREEVARGVILILGSGLGQAQHDFLQLAIAGPTGELAMDRLSESMGATGTVRPVDPVSDAAAGATTLATGMPTAPGAIGVDADGEDLSTVLEHARDAGKATGLVTTAEVTDPTVAAFAAHLGPRPVPVAHGSEDAEEATAERTIARQYLEQTEVDVVLGGGARSWSSLVGQARELGYATISDAEQLQATTADRLLGLFADGPMFEAGPPGRGRYAPAVPLPDMTRAALAALDRREAGFFLVVDEAALAEAARAGNGAMVLEAGRALEATVQAALEFQAVNPGTLIVVAGFHETGGLSIALAEPGASRPGANGPFPVTDSDQEVWLRWTRRGPTNAPVPITASGPGAEAFEGSLTDTQIFPKLLEAMSLRA